MIKAIGGAGESAAARYLEKLGYRIIERNWHTRWAEIDIVAQDGETTVMVEVKTRHQDQQASAEESMTPYKIATLVRSAHMYMQKHPGMPDAIRIDFVGVEYAQDRSYTINHIKNITV